MDRKYTIAVDTMGGDNAPLVVIAGIDSICGYLEENRIDLLLFGQTELLAPLLAKYPAVSRISRVIQADEVVVPDDKPSRVIRSGRKTSMWMAIESVRNKEADAVVSAGNTGCLMGISKLLISMIEGIRRPAITTCIPSDGGKFTTLLDLGANAECDEYNIFEFAIMGSTYAKLSMGIERPKVSILNIGSEAGKGLEYLNKAAQLIEHNKENISFDYSGFVEGDDIFKGKVDVIVTDGFSGNISLKTLEGTVKFVVSELKSVFRKSVMSMIGLLFMYFRLRKFKKRLDPREYNGAVFLGLNGIVVKSHGGTDAYGFACAMKYAVRLVTADFAVKVQEEMEKMDENE
ncbi:MAG: phosphate acyltransferase PlsX [Rickettsiales bacterium]|jgi:glycerol-3-phosphate acyltransferase PlsX|nr:phosphate acyltransferase PlsX [Rickettsiales bacterium]